MSAPKTVEAYNCARELLHQACAALDKVALGDLNGADEAFKWALLAADKGRQAIRPEPPTVAAKAEVDAALRAGGCS
jgi:hypothetical protein